MLRVFICDDIPEDLRRIQGLLAEFQSAHPQCELEVSCFSGSEALLAADRELGGAELYLLDILLPEKNGIELARILRSRGRRGVLLYFTSSREYALEAFSVEAVNYLLKPIEPEAFFRALEAVLQHRGPEPLVAIPTSAGEECVPPCRIAYVEQTRHIFHYHLGSGRTILSKSLRVPFEEATRELLGNAAFLRPHQSFLVNAGWVAKLATRELFMKNGERIPISRLRLADVRARYLDYLLQSEGGGRDLP